MVDAMLQKTPPKQRVSIDPYARIGVRPVINCAGFRAISGNARVLPEVGMAMRAAAGRFVDLDELMEGVGRRLAELTGAEWGLVTAGSAAALCLATAACAAGNDPEKMLRLPTVEQDRDVVIVPSDQRFAYEQAIRMAGCRIVTVADAVALEDRIGDGAAMVCVLARSEGKSALSLETIVEAAGRKGVPVLVDAAAIHLEQPDPWLARGADMVAYSGGKFLRGPASTGLLLGKSEILRAAWANASPHQAFGRPLKVGKEEIVGLLVAVESWFEKFDHNAEYSCFKKHLQKVITALAPLHHVTTEMLEPTGLNRVPRLRVCWDLSQSALSGLQLRDRLLAGEPRIMLDDVSARRNSVTIDPFNLDDCEAQKVAEQLYQELAARQVARQCAAPDIDPRVESGAEYVTTALTGTWRLDVLFAPRSVAHFLDLNQDGAALHGMHRTPYSEAQVRGTVFERGFVLECAHPYGAGRISYKFEGQVNDAELAGLVTCGFATDALWGPVFRQQFGTTKWIAARGEAF